MPSIGSETYRSSELPEAATKETEIDEGAHPPEVIKGEDWPADETPGIESISPESMGVPGPDRELTITGWGFRTDSVIVWNEGDETTEFVSDTELKTVVKPSTVQAPLPFTLPVQVRNGDLISNTVTFTFEESDVPRHRHGKR